MNRYLKTSMLLAAMALASMPGMAQKLSHDAEMMLARRNAAVAASRPMSRVPAEKAETVRVFIQASDAEAVRRIEALGGTVNCEFGDILTATVPVGALRSVSELPEVGHVATGTGVKLLLDTARIVGNVNPIHTNKAGELPSAYTGKGIVVGVIDTGLEYNHPAFWTTDGQECRIRAVWDQNAFGKSPEGFGYGAEFTTPAEIKAAAYDSGSSYHGAHTTGIAAGGDKRSKYYGVATDADIVYVSFGTTNVDIANAIRYIFDYADRVGKPCVINMSLGSHSGPHDGTSYLDQIIDSSVGPGRIIVGACGNEGLANIHVTKTFAEGDTKLQTMLVPSDGTQYASRHVVEVWGTTGSDLKISAVIVDANKGRILRQTPVYDTTDPDQSTIIKSFYLESDGGDVDVMIAGSENPVTGVPSACVDIMLEKLGNGRQVGLIVEGAEGSTVHAWNLAGNDFISNNIRNWSAGDNNFTVGEIGGTANGIITVGSFDNRERVYWIDNTYSYAPNSYPGHRSFFSSVGPTVDGRIVPHILAPGNPVISAINKRGFGMSLSDLTCEMLLGYDLDPYYYSYDIGTSMAAPFVAGTIALWLEAFPELTPDQAREALAASASTDEFMGELPNNSYGAGRVDAYAGLKHLFAVTGAGRIEADSQPALKAWNEPGTKNVCIVLRDEGADVEIYNAAGARVASLTSAGGLTTVDASAWGHGVFIIRALTASGSQTAKVAL